MSAIELQFGLLIFALFCLTVLGVVAMSRGEVEIVKLIVTSIKEFTRFKFTTSMHKDEKEDGDKS